MFDLRNIVIGAVTMLKKYTCINLTVNEEITCDDTAAGIFTLPILGFAIGIIAYLLSLLRYFYDAFFISTLIIAYISIITKTKNLKDIYRAFNYFFKTKDQSESIAGITGIVIILLLYFSMFGIMPSTAFLIMPAAGISSLIIVSRMFSRKNDFSFIIKECDRSHVIFAFTLTFAVAALFNYKLIVPLALTYMSAGFAVYVLNGKLRLLPNSIEGFIIEISQIIFLFFTCLLKI